MNRKKQANGPNLYLVGFMGVGKSTVGSRVARELNFAFYGSDEVIEERVGKSVSEIFSEDGEAAFRRYEREFIDSGHPAEGCVVSCGGGLVAQEGMSARLKSKGVVICLFASIESIIQRTQRGNQRPLLDVDDPEARIRKLFAEREPIYMNAGISISTEGRSISEVVKHVLRTYRTAARELLERRTSNIEH